MSTLPSGKISFSDLLAAHNMPPRSPFKISIAHGLTDGVPSSGKIAFNNIQGKTRTNHGRIKQTAAFNEIYQDVTIMSMVAQDNVIHMTGSYSSSIDLNIPNMDGSMSSYTLPQSNSSDVFYMKYSDTGICMGAYNILPGTGSDIGYSIDIDKTNNVLYICGIYSSTTPVTVGNLDGSNSAFTLPINRSTFILKYDLTTNICSMAFSVQNAITLSSLKVDPLGNLYVTGRYTGGTTTLLNFNNTSSGFSLPSGTNRDFITKYNLSGQCILGSTISNSFTSTFVTSLGCTTNGNLFVAGFVNATANTSGTVNNLNGTSALTMSVASGNSHAVLLQYDGVSGQCISAIEVYPCTTKTYNSMFITSNDDIYLTGLCSVSTYTLKHLDGSASGITLTSSTNASILLKYSGGQCVLGTPIFTSGSINRWTTGITGSNDGSLFIVGVNFDINSTTIRNLDGSLSTYSIPARAGGENVFIVKYNTNNMCEGGSTVTRSTLATAVANIINAVVSTNKGLVFSGTYSSNMSTSGTQIFGNLDGSLSSFVTSTNGQILSGVAVGFLGSINGINLSSLVSFCQGFTTFPRPSLDPQPFLDSNGNLCLHCMYLSTQSITIPNLDGSMSQQQLPATLTSPEFCIVRYDNKGKCVFAKLLCRPTSSFTCNTIIFDSNDNMYIIGIYSGSAQFFHFDGQAGPSFPVVGSSSGFLVKYNSSGICMGAIRTFALIQGTCNTVHVAPNQSILIGGSYNGGGVSTFNIDGSASTVKTPTGTVTNSYIQTYNVLGSVTSMVNIVPASGSSVIHKIMQNTQTGNLLVAVSYSSSTAVTIRNLDGTNSIITLPTSAGTDIAIITYSSNGTCLSASSIIAGTGNDVFGVMQTDHLGNLYVCGTYLSSTLVKNLDGTSSGLSLPTPVGSSNTYLLIFDVSGACVSAARFMQNLNNVTLNSLHIDGNRNIYVGGFLQPLVSITVNNLDNTVSSLQMVGTVTNRFSPFVIKYNALGKMEFGCVPVQATSATYGSFLYSNLDNTLNFVGNYSSVTAMTVRNLRDGTTAPMSLQRTGPITSSIGFYVCKYIC